MLVVTVALGLLGPGAIVWFLDAGGVFLGIVWFLVVLAKYRLPKRFPGIERPYRVRPGFLPAIGGVGALLVIGFTVAPGTQLSLEWPAEYIILIAWVVLGAILFLVTPKPDDGEETFRDMVGPAAEELLRTRKR